MLTRSSAVAEMAEYTYNQTMRRIKKVV